MDIKRFGYYWLDTWILANFIQLATQDFCVRNLNRTNDPCGRQYDQMTQAARSVTANIVEGNCLIVLCNRLFMMLGKHLELLLENFRKEGGFTEALTADRLNGRHNLSLTLDDVQGITEFGLAFGCQIHKAVKVNTGKLFTPFLFVAIDIRTDVLRCYKLFNALYK